MNALIEPIEDWRRVWRETYPMLSTSSLLALECALIDDDPTLIQKANTSPPPIKGIDDWPVEAACLLAFRGWKEGLRTVSECEEYMARLCFEIDQQVGVPAGCRWLLHWWDNTPRSEAIAALLPEVRRAIAERQAECQ